MQQDRSCLFALAVLAGLVLASPATAQIAKAPAEVQQKIAEMGAKLDADLVKTTMGLYVPLVRAAPPLDHVKVATDIAYGDDPLEKLDIFQPENQQKMAIVVFVHGGGYVRGDKSGNGPIYDNVAAFFARQGMLGLNVNYRLAPKDPWPAATEDIGKVVTWIKANAGAYGGDPQRIFVMGHSAGATHVASYVLNPALQPKEGAGIVGAILVSGEYLLPAANVPVENIAPNLRAYFGDDVSKYAGRSPITHVRESKLPLLLATAEYDPVFLAVPTYQLAQQLCARDGKCPCFAWLKGHNHISEMASFDTADQQFPLEVADFVRRTR